MMYLIMVREAHRGAHDNGQQARDKCFVDLVDNLHRMGICRLGNGCLYEYNGLGCRSTVDARNTTGDRRRAGMDRCGRNHCQDNRSAKMELCRCISIAKAIADLPSVRCRIERSFSIAMAVHPDVFERDAVSQANLNHVGSCHSIPVFIGRHRPTVQVVDTKMVVPEAHSLLLEVI